MPRAVPVTIKAGLSMLTLRASRLKNHQAAGPVPCPSYFLSGFVMIGLITLKEHSKFSSTLITAPALSNSLQ